MDSGPARARSEYDYRWYRCKGRGAADASDCTRISNASNNAYTLREADAGFQLRTQIVATNADGSTKATSNPTSVVTSARPTNTKEPTVTGTATVGSTLQANRGEWAGEQPITYSFTWLRCDAQGDNCSEVPGANDTSSGQVGRQRPHPAGEGHGSQRPRLDLGDLEPDECSRRRHASAPSTGGSVGTSRRRRSPRRLAGEVLPIPVRSRTAPITVRVQVTARGGRPVNGARVFMRATPRVVTGQTQVTGGDGYATLTLVPNAQFPQPRNGFNVQFFIKAYRAGDPPLGGARGLPSRPGPAGG